MLSNDVTQKKKVLVIKKTNKCHQEFKKLFQHNCVNVKVTKFVEEEYGTRKNDGGTLPS
jgi:hypothetical protein